MLDLHAHHDARGLESTRPSPLEQLCDLATSLPRHIEHTVLPGLTGEILRSTSELGAQVDDTRQLLLQSAILRRSAVLAPLLQQQLVRDAAHLQRARAQLLQTLQKQERQLRSDTASNVAAGRVWSALETAMKGEERFAHVVQAPLRPSTTALSAFLAAAVTQQGLHRHVHAQVEGSSTASSPSPQPDGSSESVVTDAVEASLHLLLNHIRLDASPREGTGESTIAQGRKGSHTDVSSGPVRRPASPTAGGAGGSVVDLDGDVDVDAEEDELRIADPSSQEHQQRREGPKAGPWLRVPGIVSLGQYCADFPWVVELAEEQYVAAKERKNNGGASSSRGGGDAGYFSRHVQRDEREAQAKGGSGKAAQLAAAAAANAAPLGCVFAPSLAAGAAPTSATGSRAEVTFARTRRTNLSSEADAVVSPTSEWGEGALPMGAEGGGHMGGERVDLARSVSQCVVPAVDAAWADVEETVLLPFCQTLAKPVKTRRDSNIDLREAQEDEEEKEAVSTLLEVVRVRYAVELAARVVASRQAIWLLLDSEDGVIFDGARLQSLSLHGGSNSCPATQQQQQEGIAVAASPAALTCIVLTLPGLEEMFYVVAYCAGAAMLREASAAASTPFPRVGEGGALQPLVIDVDAPEKDSDDGGNAEACIDEEDVTAQQQARLRTWATSFEQRFLSAGSPVAASLRLWLYLWEFALTVPPTTASSSSPGAAVPVRQPLRAAAGTPSALHVSLRTARRWMEKTVDASLRRGGAESGVVRAAATAVGAVEDSLPRCWSAAERDRIVRLTSAQARQALLRAAGVDAFA